VNEIFWIDVEPRIPLAVVLCPLGDGSLESNLASFKKGGIQTVVCLLEKLEASWLGLAQEGPLAVQLGMQFLSHPIPDGNLPQNPAAFSAFVADLANRVRAGERIGIHCRGSIGRATVTAACTLIHLGFPPANALAAVESARGCPVPDTFEQQRWILSYKARP
jgi:protein-tyrosine phosphatase